MSAAHTCAGGLSIPWFDPSDPDSVLCLDPPRLSTARRFAVTLGCPYDHWFARRTEGRSGHRHFVSPGPCAWFHDNRCVGLAGQVDILPWRTRSCAHLRVLALAENDVWFGAKRVAKYSVSPRALQEPPAEGNKALESGFPSRIAGIYRAYSLVNGRYAAKAAVRADNPYSDNAKTTATLRLTRHPVP